MKKTYSSSFKGKVALEACLGTSTIAEIAGKYQVHPNQIQQRKKKLQSEVGIIFEINAKRKARENKNYTRKTLKRFSADLKNFQFCGILYKFMIHLIL